jgi:AmmeMemoRadiSam system protein A
MMGDELAQDARRQLLTVARRAITEWLDGAAAPPAPPANPTLREPRGAFVSLKRKHDGALRGCVGFPEARYPLFEAVARAAVAAASNDYRFAPVTRPELPSLLVQVSALGPVSALPPDRIEVGIHGLIVRCDGRGGLLLPQVAAELGWGREQLLAGACVKAGLPARAWQRPDAVILAFTAQVFGEDR